MTELISFERQKHEEGSVYRFAIITYKTKSFFGKEKTHEKILVACFGASCWRTRDDKYLPHSLGCSVRQCLSSKFDFIHFPTKTYL